MNRLFVLSTFLFFCLTANAQIRFGIKAGAATTEVDVNELKLLSEGGGERLEVALNEARWGVHGGVFLRLPLGESFLLQPELIFNSNTVEYDVEDLDQQGLGRQLLKEKYQYLDIPLLFGLRLGPLRLNAGPQGHVFLDSTSDLLDFDEYDQQFDDLTISFLGGVGLDLWNLTLDVRYEGNFNKFGDHIRFAGRDYEFDENPARWVFSIGWMLGG